MNILLQTCIEFTYGVSRSKVKNIWESFHSQNQKYFPLDNCYHPQQSTEIRVLSYPCQHGRLCLCFFIQKVVNSLSSHCVPGFQVKTLWKAIVLSEEHVAQVMFLSTFFEATYFFTIGRKELQNIYVTQTMGHKIIQVLG